MAGFTTNKLSGGNYEFHINDEFLTDNIRAANKNARVITLQLDGDELEAALWGLENYSKPFHSIPECSE